MGIPKAFNFLGCLEVTLVLRDYKTVTGKIRDFDDRKSKDYDNYDDCKKENDKCCKPPNLDVKVDVDDKCDFILLELTRDAESVSLQTIEASRKYWLDDGLSSPREIDGQSKIEIEWVNVEFKKGLCIAVNVCDILYAGVNADIDKERFEICLTPPALSTTATTSNSTTTEPTA